MNLILCLVLTLGNLTPTPEIVGTVVDDQGKPVSGVPIFVVALPYDRVVKETLSGSDGSFMFASVTSGGYGLQAKSNSACAFSAAIQVDSGFTSVVRLRLVKGLCQRPIGFAKPPANR